MSTGRTDECTCQKFPRESDSALQRGLLSLELRSGISLARLWAGRGEADRALELLEPIFSRFSGGFQTLDLMAAAELLAKLQSL